MALVEGFGDEVIQFFAILSLVILIVLLWMSTQVAEMQLFRGAVFILERRTRRRHHDAIRPASVITSQQPVETTTEDVSSNSSTSNSINLADENSISQIKNENTTAEDSEGTTNETVTQFTKSSQESCDDNNTSEPKPSENSIKIRLKYLNDDCRLVEGRPQENIGVFKRRHFSSELSANKIVRLIFQGKVLHDDEASLISYGLHDNCVVHCLIHQPRSSSNTQQSSDPVDHNTGEQPQSNIGRHGQRQNGPVQREWNLATLLSALITIIISLLWYARLQFYTLFSYTSTGTLGILTGIFLFTAFLTYLVDNEEQQQQRQPAGQ